MMICNETKKYQYMGAIHIHSKYSDGTGDINSISKAAKLAGLDWIIITDHNCFDIQEGFYNGICVIKGEEISHKNSNHYLALGINKLINPIEDIQACIDEVHKQGGFGFAAHPDEGLRDDGNPRKNKHRPLRWTDKNILPDGIEIWNWFSNWADNYDSTSILKIAYSYFFKNNLVKKAPIQTLKWWDERNNKSKEIIPAIGGVDAHALRITDYILPITVFPYLSTFKTITNILTIQNPLSKDFETCKKQILNALKNGNNTILNRHIGNIPPKFYIYNKNATSHVGDNIELDEFTYLKVETNKKSNIKIFHNGIEFFERNTSEICVKIEEKGKYRIEIHRCKNGFAYSNPIIVY